MSEYNFREIEKKWQNQWISSNTFKTEENSEKPKFYILDMFPYPSGAGLHVGHPLGYIASDIVARHKRLQGYNVLHPMGFDAFGLPAEQYAIQTGQHPAVTTEENLSRYKQQLNNLGFSYDWDREIRTTDPSYYKHTQWIFIQLFNSWYNKDSNKAEKIETLISLFETGGTDNINASSNEEAPQFSAKEWRGFNEQEQQTLLLNYRLAYLSDTLVNWCPELGSVLANDEIKDGVSERGGYAVERKKMQQWSLRITAYSDRLLKSLNNVEWTDAIKEIQRNWIGKSFGCSLKFNVQQSTRTLEVFTTRIDTVFGVTYVCIAPEHELVNELTTLEQQQDVIEYVTQAKAKSETERQAGANNVTGVFSGTYVEHPITKKQIPLWVADYVLASYGTGVVMAVPASDERDYKFATHFNLPIINIQKGDKTDIAKDNFDAKSGVMINSDFLNGLTVDEAIKSATKFVEEKEIGTSKVNYKLRDAVFGRQRYWGEPIPIFYKNNIPYTLDESELPLELPEIDNYKPTETGEPPLGRAKEWTNKEGYPLELTTMPGWAGSSWYYLRYMDNKNTTDLASKKALNYWQDVDLYLGGSEHATGHLLYARFWNLFLYDLGIVPKENVFKKLINQGMIQGRSSFVYRINDTNTFVSKGLKHLHKTTPLHVDVSFVNNDILDVDKFKNWRAEYANAEFILEKEEYKCGSEVEKMSKSKYNVVNPDDIVERFGADTLRLYEMFLGPLEQSKPWSTNGIEGVHKFLKKLWRLFHINDILDVSDDKPTNDELKVLHSTIKKINHDLETLSLNTSVSNFMICVNELSSLRCNKRIILHDLLIILSPYAPHISEELWSKIGNLNSISNATFPTLNESVLVESTHEYPVMINGKMRTKITFSIETSKERIEKEVLENDTVKKWLEGNAPKKLIVVPKKIINVVV